MTDNKYGSGIAADCILQDTLGLDIQMVCRLIEDDDVRTCQKQTSQCDSHLLTTG